MNRFSLSWLALLCSVAAVAKGEALEQQLPSPSQSSPKLHNSTAHTGTAAPDLGSVAAGLYRNSSFRFSYKIPMGWVERTQDMSADSQSREPSKSLVLLAIFERPPEATGDTVNSAVIIAAESTSSYPGLKTAADYFEPLMDLTTRKGFKVVNGPYEFSSGAVSLVRADFSKELGKLTMNQSSLAMLQKGYLLSFTFIGGSEDEIEELIARLRFAGTSSSAAGKFARPH